MSAARTCADRWKEHRMPEWNLCRVNCADCVVLFGQSEICRCKRGCTFCACFRCSQVVVHSDVLSAVSVADEIAWDRATGGLVAPEPEFECERECCYVAD